MARCTGFQGCPNFLDGGCIFDSDDTSGIVLERRNNDCKEPINKVMALIQNNPTNKSLKVISNLSKKTALPINGGKS